MPTINLERVDWIRDELLPAAAMSVWVVGKCLEDPDRKGGYFCHSIGNTEHLTLLVSIGEFVGEERSKRYRRNALEKAHRLTIMSCNPTFMLRPVIASYETRRPHEELWGGGIAVKREIFSFSGFPEHADEAAMLLTALRLDKICRAEAISLAEKTENQFYLSHEGDWSKLI